MLNELNATFRAVNKATTQILRADLKPIPREDPWSFFFSDQSNFSPVIFVLRRIEGITDRSAAQKGKRK